MQVQSAVTNREELLLCSTLRQELLPFLRQFFLQLMLRNALQLPAMVFATARSVAAAKAIALKLWRGPAVRSVCGAAGANTSRLHLICGTPGGHF
jgi:hypothetical protein